MNRRPKRRFPVFVDLSNTFESTNDIMAEERDTTKQSQEEDTRNVSQDIWTPPRRRTSTDDDVVMVGCEFIIRPPELPSEPENTEVINLCTPYVPRRRPFLSNEIITIEDPTPPPPKRRQADKPIANGSDTSEHHQCAICMGSYLTRNPSSTLCGHVFCEVCVMTAISLSKRCPICKTKLNNKKVHRIFI